MSIFFKTLCILWCVIGTGVTGWAQLSSDSIQKDTSYVDSMHLAVPVSKVTFYDTLENDQWVTKQFYGFMQNRASTNDMVIPTRRNLPTSKELQPRKSNTGKWKFWIIAFILLYIAFVRNANANNFRVFMLSVFNLKLSSKIWEEQRYTFSFTTIQLFAIYIMIGALFISGYMEMNQLQFLQKPVYEYFAVVGILILTYTVKFMIHSLLGALLKIKKLSISFVANTVSVNNFLALVIFPFIIFFTYNRSPLFSYILSQVVITIFFIGVAYRLIRIYLLSGQFIQLPKIYLFAYLCALEIIPWFIIIHALNKLHF